MTNIAIIGAGYIGLVIGGCLADFGNRVIFADINSVKINQLKNNIIPVYEPGLNELIKKGVNEGLVDFTTDLQHAIESSKIIFITAGTPTGQNGHADISAIKSIAESIGKHINDKKIVCIKSTVPIGTHKIVESIIKQNNDKYDFEVVSVPEFLREGTAITDFISPDRIIIGTKSEKTFDKLRSLFVLSTKCSPDKIIWTNNLAAETIKYVSNSFLALKVSYINEIANFCDEIGVDALEVAQGVGFDKRIGKHFLNPGPGFGGSCFPKDVLALNATAKELNIDLKTVRSSLEINDQQKKHVVEKLRKLLKNELQDKTIAILGLAFKKNTDDIRESPAIDIINHLVKENVKLKLHDPKANDNMRFIYPNLSYYDDPYETVKDANAILVLTEWDEYKILDFLKIGNLVKEKNILDTRNILNISHLKKLNFACDSIGRSVICAQEQDPNYSTISKLKRISVNV